MKTLLTILLFLSTSLASAGTIGYLYGAHYPNNILNNSHPFVDFGNVLVFQNSFDRTSIAAFYHMHSEYLHLRLGATTGYSGLMSYKGNKYEQNTILGLLPFIAPSFEYPGKYCNYIFTILGNSANIGIGIEF